MDARARQVGEITPAVGSLRRVACHPGDRIRVRVERARVDHRVSMDEIDVIVTGERVEPTAGQPFDDALECEGSGDQPGRGVERRVGGIQEAEVDFPFVPSARALHDVVRAVD